MASLSVSALEKGYVCSINQAAGVQLVSDTSSPQEDSSRIGTAEKSGPKTEPATNPVWIVRVNMGQQPSGGYGLRLISDHLKISDDTASVALEWLQPKPGSVQIQALTYPCIYLRIAKGSYSRLDFVDQHGEIRYTLDLE
ncbi:MAG: protease complex subunit PrcB family protein [Candidatus Thiodiazotropha sp.]